RWWSAGSYGSATGRRAGARPEPPAPAAPPSERRTGSRRVGGLLPVDESERLEVPQCLEGQHAGPRHSRAPARAGGRIVTPRPYRPPGSVFGLFVDELVELTAHFGSQRARQLRVGSRRDGQGLEAVAGTGARLRDGAAGSGGQQRTQVRGDRRVEAGSVEEAHRPDEVMHLQARRLRAIGSPGQE